MKRIYLFLVLFMFISALGFSQIYTLKDNEKVKDSYILSENDYALIIENYDRYLGTNYAILYNGNYISGYKDFGIIKILPNGTLVATMLKPSVATNSWAFIYGNTEQIFDSIERTVFSKDGNRSIIFARILDYGVALVDGTALAAYSELYDANITKERYAFSYMRDDTYYINIDGIETQIEGKADNITFSKDASKLVYVINGEENAVIVDGETRSEPYRLVEYIAISPNALMLAYAAKPMPLTNEYTNDNTNGMFTNLSMIGTNNILSNVESYISEEGMTVKGPSNTIALVNITDIMTNVVISTVDISTNIINTNEITKTSVFLNGRMYGEYDVITNMSFSPDSKNLLFVVVNTNDNLYGISISGTLTQYYNEVYSYKYSPDSKYFVYGAKTNNTAFIVLNGKRLLGDYNLIKDFYFSENDSIAYIVENKGRQYIIASDFESPYYSNIISFKFIGNSFAFTAERLGKYYYFIYDKNSPFKSELGSYDYISGLSDNTNSALAIIATGKMVYMIKNGVIIKNNE